MEPILDIYNPTEEHQILRQTLKEFVQKEVEPQAAAHDKKEAFNLPLFKKIGDLGLLGLTVQDKKWGGAGMDTRAACLVHEELSYSDPGFCLAYLAHSILCVHNLDQNASPQQKEKWLPPLCSGSWLGAMAMSEPAAGTDVLSMTTTAQKTADHYILNGRKMWITNGVLDDKGTLPHGCLVYAQYNQKINAFFILREFKGFKSGQHIKDKTGMRASHTAELVFDHCRIPLSHRVGGAEGQGLKQMMKNLEIERLTLAAMSLGIGKRALDEMNRYASSRKAFGQPIRNFGQIQRHLAESYSEFQSCRSYVYSIAGKFDMGKNQQRLESDSAKLICAQMGKKIADRAIQVLGAYGYVGEYTVERLWRDAKLLEIGGGTNEALQKNITKELENNLNG